jgi:hypothetical protein
MAGLISGSSFDPRKKDKRERAARFVAIYQGGRLKSRQFGSLDATPSLA